MPADDTDLACLVNITLDSDNADIVCCMSDQKKPKSSKPAGGLISETSLTLRHTHVFKSEKREPIFQLSTEATARHNAHLALTRLDDARAVRT